MELVLLKYDNATVGVTIPIASETNPGMLSGESFRDFVKQSQLQSLYDELYQIMSDLSLAEKERNDAEQLRNTKENERITAETNRINAENVRQSEESKRIANEDNRKTTEDNRNTAEQLRDKAEGYRATTFETLKGELETTIQSGQEANTLSEAATQRANEAAQTIEEWESVVVTVDDEGDVNDPESDVVNEAIRKTPQTLSKAEQSQARKNIGAASLDESNEFKAQVEEQVGLIDGKVTDLASEVSADIASLYGTEVEFGYAANNTSYGGGYRGLNHRIKTDVIIEKVLVNGNGSVNFYEMSKNSDGTFTIVQDLGLYTLSGLTTLNVNWSLSAGHYIAWGAAGSGISYHKGTNLAGLSFGSSLSNKATEDYNEWDVKVYGATKGFNQIEEEISDVKETITLLNRDVVSKIDANPNVNIVNPSIIINKYGLRASDFQEVFLDSGFCISGYIKVDGQNICANSFNRAGYASFVVYDVNYNPLRSIENNSQYIYQEGDYYVRITFNHSDNVKKLYANYGDVLLPFETYFPLGGYIEDVLDSIDKHSYKIGNSQEPTAYYTGVLQAVCVNYVIPTDGILETIKINCNSESEFDIVSYSRNANLTWNVEDYIASIKCVSGINEFEINAPVKKGHYIGFNGTSVNNSIGYTPDGSSGELKLGSLNLKGKHFNMNGTANNYCIECIIKPDTLSKGVEPMFHSTSLVDSSLNTGDLFISNGFNGFDAITENACVYYKEMTWLDKFVEHIEFKLNKPEDTKVVLCQPSGDARGNGGYYVSLDTSAKKLSIHSNWNGDTSAEPSVFASVDIPFIIGNAHTYIIDVVVDSVKTLTARFTDRFTQEYVEVSDITTGDSHYHGNGVYCGVLLKKGHINITRFKIYSDAPVRPTLAIYGDSYCQGYNLLRGGEDINLRYPQLIKDYLNGDATIICKGGRTSVDMEEIMDSDMNLIVGKYTLLAIGLNNNIVSNMSLIDFRVSMSKLINKVRRYGSKPILVTYPRWANDELSEQYDSWVTNYITIPYLDVREATAVKEGAYGTVDQTLYLNDAHPNAAGNKKIFERFVIDFGDIKSDL